MATEKQLAALKKARAARAKKAKVKKPAISTKAGLVAAKAKVVKRRAVKVKAAATPKKYVVKVTKNNGQSGYFVSEYRPRELDTDINIATIMTQKNANAIARSLFESYPAIIHKVEVILKK
jgi:uncharacterized protein (DUF3084 family)